MHELSVALNIIEIVKENVPENNLGDVKKILLDIGEFSGIVVESLQFSFDISKQESPIQNANLKINKIPFKIFCNKCKIETSNAFGICSCEKCGSFDTINISGTEMKITEIELN